MLFAFPHACQKARHLLISRDDGLNTLRGTTLLGMCSSISKLTCPPRSPHRFNFDPEVPCNGGQPFAVYVLHRFHRSASGRDSKDSAAASHQPAALCRAGFPFTAPVHRVFIYSSPFRSYFWMQKSLPSLVIKRRQAVHLRGTTLVASLLPAIGIRETTRSPLRRLTVAVYYPACTTGPELKIRHFHCSASRRVAGSFDCVAPSRSSLIPDAYCSCSLRFTYPFGI